MNKWKNLCDDLREQSAAAFETVQSIGQDPKALIDYANYLVDTLNDIATKIEDLSNDAQFKAMPDDLKWVNPDSGEAHMLVKHDFQNDLTLLYGWIRSEGFLYCADVQVSEGNFKNLANVPMEGADIDLLKILIEDVAHEVTPIVIPGVKYAN